MSRRDKTTTRRDFLRRAGQTIGAATVSGFPGLSAFAQEKTITAVMSGAILPAVARPIVERRRT